MQNNNEYFNQVLFIGPEYRGQRGGMAAVLDVYAHTLPQFNFIPTYRKGGTFFNLFFFLNALIKFVATLISKKDIKIVHLHSASRGSFFRKSILILIAKIFGKKTVIHIHGGEFKIFYQNTGKFKSLIRFVLNKTDEIICLSGEWKTYFDSITNSPRSIVVNNPVILPPNSAAKKLNSPLIVLYMNHITAGKGIFDLLDYFIANKEYLKKDFKLVIAGAGDGVEKLESMIAANDLSGLVSYQGWVTGDAKDKLIQDCNLFILPSYNEGLPMSILETMSFGSPVISTTIGGIPRIVRPGENGWLMAPGDKAALGEIFTQIKQDPSVLLTYSVNSLKIVQEYSPDKVSKQLAGIYASLESISLPVCEKNKLNPAD